MRHGWMGLGLLLILVLPLGADPARWRAEMERFDREDAAHTPEPGGVLFVGSSSIRGWNLKTSFPELDALNRGFGGSQLTDVLHYFDRVVARYRPRLVVLYGGENDIAAGRSPQEVAAAYRQFATQLHERLPECRLLFIALKPSPLRWEMFEKMSVTNALIRAHIAHDTLAAYVDVVTPMLTPEGKPRAELFVEDRLHLNAEGYKLWASLLEPHLDGRR